MMIWSDTDAERTVVVNVPDRSFLLQNIDRYFADRKGFTVATINLDHVVKLAKDPLFRNAYAAHSHVTADGNPIVWLERLSGRTDIFLVPGSEMIEPVAALAAKKEVPVALFGASECSLTAAAKALENQNPGLNIVLTLAPPMGFDPDSACADDMIALLRESGARLVFLALGAPKQERFAIRAAETLTETGFLSIGAGLDFVAGVQSRAPKWIRAIAAEWLWRLCGDPKRLAFRYALCLLVLPKLTLKALALRRRAREAA